LDDESILKYIVEGIPDSNQNTTSLNQASNLKEFREKLKVYEKICASHGFESKPKIDSSLVKTNQEADVALSLVAAIMLQEIVWKLV